MKTDTEPRYTQSWKARAQHFAALVLEALGDADVRQAWEQFARAVRVLYDALVDPTTKPSGQMRECEDRLKVLVGLLEERAPDLARWCGFTLPDWVAAITVSWCGEDPGPILPRRMERLSPDNPFFLDAVGQLVNPHEGHWKDWQEVERYFASLRPLGRAGRPRNAPKTGGKQLVSPDLALRAYRAKADGENWLYIARNILHEKIPSDHQARERLRNKVRYLTAAGWRHYHKKP